MATTSSRWLFALVLLFAPMLACEVVAQPDDVGPSEYALKAAFVYQFLSYVTWPPARGEGAIVIGVVASPELVNNLVTLARSQETGARTVEVRALSPDADPGALHVLFVNAQASATADELLQRAAANGVLTITEELPRPEQSIINFEIIDNRVRFDVALGLARQGGLEISARLLQVALRVIDP